MRILLVSYQDRRSMGGALSILETIADEMSRLGYDVEILFVYKGFESIGNSKRFKVLYLRAHSAIDIAAIARFLRLLKNGKHSIVHFVDPINVLSVVSCLAHPRTVLHVHGREWGVPLHLYWISKIKSRMCAATIAITSGVKRSLVERGISAANKVSVIPNSVHRRFLDIMRETAPIQTRLRSDDRIVLGFGARHNKCKSPEEAIRLLRWLPDNYTLLIAGEGEQTPYLKNLVASMNLASRVEFIGTVADMSHFYAVIDYYLFFSKYEPFGLVIAEAMACGVPVLGFRGEGEYFEPEYPLVDSSTALLLPRSDPFLGLDEIASPSELEALAVAICSLEHDSIKRGRMVQNALVRVQTYFSPWRFAADLESFYQAVCGNTLSTPLPHYPEAMSPVPPQ